MANPHLRNAQAIGKDIQKKGMTIKKAHLMNGALKRAHHHKEGTKNRGREY